MLEYESKPSNPPANTNRLNNKSLVSPSFSDLLKGGMGCESNEVEVGAIKTPRIQQLRSKSEQRLLNIHQYNGTIDLAAEEHDWTLSVRQGPKRVNL